MSPNRNSNRIDNNNNNNNNSGKQQANIRAVSSRSSNAASISGSGSGGLSFTAFSVVLGSQILHIHTALCKTMDAYLSSSPPATALSGGTLSPYQKPSHQILYNQEQQSPRQQQRQEQQSLNTNNIVQVIKVTLTRYDIK
jgi:hypothetical protein